MELLGTIATAVAVFSLCVAVLGRRCWCRGAWMPSARSRSRASSTSGWSRPRCPLGADRGAGRGPPGRPGARVRLAGPRARHHPGRLRSRGHHARRGLCREARPRRRDPRGRCGPDAAAARGAADRAPDRLRRLPVPDRVPRVARQGPHGPARAGAARLPRPRAPARRASTASSTRSPTWPTRSTTPRRARTCSRARSGARSPPMARAPTCSRRCATSRPRPSSRSSTSSRPRSSQSRRLGKGIAETLAEHERSLRDAERNRLAGAASTVQPKLAAILAGIYLPEFVLLVVAPLFISTLGRI